MTAEKGLCLKDEFLELRVRICRGDVLVGQMFAVLCLFLSASKNNRQLSHIMRHLQIIFVFFT